MLKMAFLCAKENLAVQREIKLEREKLDYVCFVNDLLFKLKAQNYQIVAGLCDDLLFVLNKIIIDNVFRYVHNKDGLSFINIISSRQFANYIFINPFYIDQVFDLISVHPDDKVEVENYFHAKLLSYIQSIYFNNSDTMNMALMDLYDSMLHSAGYLNIKYYKFELHNYYQPILMYAEATLEELVPI